MKMQDWNKEERPREKLLRRGAGALNNAELLAIFVASGSGGRNAVDVGQELLSAAGGRLTELCEKPPRELMKVKSVGEVRAVTIAAALELGRRYLAEASAQKAVVTGPRDVVRIMLPILKGKGHEECWVLYLNRANLVLEREKATSGTVDSTLFDAKAILRRAIDCQAKAVVLVHNHPSGSPLPGMADIKATQQLRRALGTLDVTLYDHVIIGNGAYYSFEEETVGKME